MTQRIDAGEPDSEQSVGMGIAEGSLYLSSADCSAEAPVGLLGGGSDPDLGGAAVSGGVVGAVALGVAWGWSDKEIAAALGCRPTSVRTHLRAVLGHLGLADRVAVREWVRRGRLDDPWIAPLLDLEDPPFRGEGLLKT